MPRLLRRRNTIWGRTIPMYLLDTEHVKRIFLFELLRIKTKYLDFLWILRKSRLIIEIKIFQHIETKKYIKTDSWEWAVHPGPHCSMLSSSGTFLSTNKNYFISPQTLVSSEAGVLVTSYLLEKKVDAYGQLVTESTLCRVSSGGIDDPHMIKISATDQTSL